jgi:phage-related protein
MATFNISTPDRSPTMDVEPKVLSSQFGDGYSQRTPDGINNMMETWSLAFTLRTKTEIDSIETFLRARAGAEAFYWTTPSNRTAKFICKKWSRIPEWDGNHALNCVFMEVPEP